MRALKFGLFLLALFALFGGAFLSYLLLAPVTANNVKFRLTSICAMGTAALRLNDAAAAEMAKLTKGSCSCLSGRVVNEAGPELAARVTEAARKLGIFGVKRKWNSSSYESKERNGILESSGLKERVIQEFSERYVEAANACEAEAV